MPEAKKPHYTDDERSQKERDVDHALKGTFPASDPPASSGSTVTPSGAEEQGGEENEGDTDR